MVNNGFWWWMMVRDDWWWLMMVNNDGQWWFMIVGMLSATEFVTYFNGEWLTIKTPDDKYHQQPQALISTATTATTTRIVGWVRSDGRADLSSCWGQRHWLAVSGFHMCLLIQFGSVHRPIVADPPRDQQNSNSFNTGWWSTILAPVEPGNQKPPGAIRSYFMFIKLIVIIFPMTWFGWWLVAPKRCAPVN